MQKYLRILMFFCISSFVAEPKVEALPPPFLNPLADLQNIPYAKPQMDPNIGSKEPLINLKAYQHDNDGDE